MVPRKWLCPHKVHHNQINILQGSLLCLILTLNKLCGVHPSSQDLQHQPQDGSTTVMVIFATSLTNARDTCSHCHPRSLNPGACTLSTPRKLNGPGF